MSGGDFRELSVEFSSGTASAREDDDVVREFSYRLQFRDGLVEDPPQLSWQFDRADPPGVVWTDWAVRLVSPAVKQILSAHAGPRDVIQWMPAALTDASGREAEYWTPHFPVWHDVLHEELTEIGSSGLPMRWVLDRSKLDGLAVFIVPRMTSHVVVRQDVADLLSAARVGGYSEQRAPQA
ncbi:hypothetical protein ACPPVT_16000 [Angustibacter sp. McL0619]|uniref:hypothetical protein n=1 Tax=Angustibacter sp. McL0619 TaxID=3415676 RepID=UPI003CE91A13